MRVFGVRVSPSSPRLPLCQISFFSRPPLLSQLVEKIAYSLTKSLTQLIWCSGKRSLSFGINVATCRMLIVVNILKIQSWVGRVWPGRRKMDRRTVSYWAMLNTVLFNAIILLTVSVEKDESDEHEQWMIAELVPRLSIPVKSASIDSHPHAHQHGRCHQQHLRNQQNSSAVAEKPRDASDYFAKFS